VLYLFSYQLYSFLNPAIFYFIFFLNFVFISCSGGPLVISGGAVSKDVKGQTPVTALAISHDAQYLLSGHDNGTVVLWNLRESKVQEIHTDLSSKILTVDINSEFGNIIAAADEQGNLIAQKIGGKTVFKHSQPKFPIFTINISLDGKTIYCGGDDSLGYVFEINSGKLKDYLYKKGTSSASVYCSALHQTYKNSYFVTGHQGGMIKIWNASDNSLIIENKFADAPITAIDFPNEKQYFAFGDAFGNIFLYSIPLEKLLKRKKSTSFITSLSFTKDGNGFISSHKDNLIRFWNLDQDTGKIKFLDKSKKIHDGYICKIIMHENLIITAGTDGFIKIMDNSYNLKATLMIEGNESWLIMDPFGNYAGSGKLLDEYSEKLIDQDPNVLDRVL
jgi:WD40 repeat protein